MTAKFLQHNARVLYGALGDPLVVVDTSDDGKQVLGSLTMRTIGLQLSVFIDGAALRAQDGAIYAPTVQSKITDTLQFTGLDPNDARRLVDLLNGGRLE